MNHPGLFTTHEYLFFFDKLLSCILGIPFKYSLGWKSLILMLCLSLTFLLGIFFPFFFLTSLFEYGSLTLLLLGTCIPCGWISLMFLISHFFQNRGTLRKNVDGVWFNTQYTERICFLDNFRESFFSPNLSWVRSIFHLLLSILLEGFILVSLLQAKQNIFLQFFSIFGISTSVLALWTKLPARLSVQKNIQNSFPQKKYVAVDHYTRIIYTFIFSCTTCVLSFFPSMESALFLKAILLLCCVIPLIELSGLLPSLPVFCIWIQERILNYGYSAPVYGYFGFFPLFGFFIFFIGISTFIPVILLVLDNGPEISLASSAAVLLPVAVCAFPYFVFRSHSKKKHLSLLVYFLQTGVYAAGVFSNLLDQERWDSNVTMTFLILCAVLTVYFLIQSLILTYELRILGFRLLRMRCKYFPEFSHRSKVIKLLSWLGELIRLGSKFIMSVVIHKLGVSALKNESSTVDAGSLNVKLVVVIVCINKLSLESSSRPHTLGVILFLLSLIFFNVNLFYISNDISYFLVILLTAYIPTCFSIMQSVLRNLMCIWACQLTHFKQHSTMIRLVFFIIILFPFTFIICLLASLLHCPIISLFNLPIGFLSFVRPYHMYDFPSQSDAIRNSGPSRSIHAIPTSVNLIDVSDMVFQADDEPLKERRSIVSFTDDDNNKKKHSSNRESSHLKYNNASHVTPFKIIRQITSSVSLPPTTKPHKSPSITNNEFKLNPVRELTNIFIASPKSLNSFKSTRRKQLLLLNDTGKNNRNYLKSKKTPFVKSILKNTKNEYDNTNNIHQIDDVNNTADKILYIQNKNIEFNRLPTNKINSINSSVRFVECSSQAKVLNASLAHRDACKSTGIRLSHDHKNLTTLMQNKGIKICNNLEGANFAASLSAVTRILRDLWLSLAWDPSHENGKYLLLWGPENNFVCLVQVLNCSCGDGFFEVAIRGLQSTHLSTCHEDEFHAIELGFLEGICNRLSNVSQFPLILNPIIEDISKGYYELRHDDNSARKNIAKVSPVNDTVEEDSSFPVSSGEDDTTYSNLLEPSIFLCETKTVNLSGLFEEENPEIIEQRLRELLVASFIFSLITCPHLYYPSPSRQVHPCCTLPFPMFSEHSSSYLERNPFPNKNTLEEMREFAFILSKLYPLHTSSCINFLGFSSLLDTFSFVKNSNFGLNNTSTHSYNDKFDVLVLSVYRLVHSIPLASISPSILWQGDVEKVTEFVELCTNDITEETLLLECLQTSMKMALRILMTDIIGISDSHSPAALASLLTDLSTSCICIARTKDVHNLEFTNEWDRALLQMLSDPYNIRAVEMIDVALPDQLILHRSVPKLPIIRVGTLNPQIVETIWSKGDFELNFSANNDDNDNADEKHNITQSQPPVLQLLLTELKEKPCFLAEPLIICKHFTL